MVLWKLIGPKQLERVEAPLPESGNGLIRVRVTKVMLNYQDAMLYTGMARAKYPFVPGRFAVGFVAEEGVPDLPKGTRVLLHSYRPVPVGGTEKKDFSADEYEACGRTTDGFLSDFVLVSREDMTELPASVSDERGLLLHYVATAHKICRVLNVQKGQHIAVVGADIVGILVCQLLIYQQASPILVDANRSRLEFAKTCGIYYTVQATAGAVSAVASYTGGRLCDGAVFIATASGNSPELPFRFSAQEKSVVFFATSINKVVVDLDSAFRKHITVQCVSHGTKFLTTAINLMANRAVDPTPFHANTVRPEETASLLEQYNLRADRDVDEINVVDLLQ